MIFADAASPSLPPTELITQLAALFITHPWSIAIFLFILAMAWNYSKVIDFVKDFLSKRSDNEAKRLEEIKDLNDKHFTLYEAQTDVLKGVTSALNDLKEFLLGFEGRITEKISSSEARLSDRIVTHQQRISDKIDNMGAGNGDNSS